VRAAASAPALPAASTVVALPASAAPAPPDFDKLDALLAAAHAQPATAWRELALRWNVAIGEGDPCVAGLQANLSCFRSANGGLTLLRQVARPVVLTLHPARGPAAYAVLVALNDGSASLQVGANRFNLALPQLLAVWRGEFASFWRTPSGWREGVDLAASAQGREWLDQGLAAAGQAAGRPLAERVRAFQLAQGLPLDGVAGPLTLMQLNRATGVDEPRLGAGR